MKRLFCLLFLIISGTALGRVVIDTVDLHCAEESDCDFLQEKFDELRGANLTELSLKERIGAVVLTGGIKTLSYELKKMNNRHQLIVNITPLQLIRKIRVNANHPIEVDDLKKQLPFHEDEFYDPATLDETKKILHKYLADKGLHGELKEISFERDGRDIDAVLNLYIEQVVRVKEVQAIVPVKMMADEIADVFKSFRGQPWDREKFKIVMSRYAKKLFERGYYFSKVEMSEVNHVENKTQVVIVLKVELGEKFNMHFRGANLFSREEILVSVREAITGMLGKFEIEELKKAIIRQYEKRGIYGTQVELRIQHGKTAAQEPFWAYYFNIREGDKIKLQEISFTGNKRLSYGELISWYRKDATVLAGRNFLDKEYMNKFVETIKREYLKRGFVFVEIEVPRLTITKEQKGALLEYEIREGQQCHVKRINIKAEDENVRKLIATRMTNQEGAAFNVIDLAVDLKKAQELARGQGYYFAKVVNELNDVKTISYNADYSEATINIELELDKKIVLNEVLITGNIETKSRVIRREIHIERNELISPEKLAEIKDRLSTLGLFSIVTVTPFVVDVDEKTDSYLVNLLVQVKEVDFGAIEVAPGYRTDIGYKLSAGLSYNNWGGMNRAASLKMQANMRDNLQGLDASRRAEGKERIEYSGKLQFTEPYLLGMPLNFETFLSVSRKRFYGFDADIWRVSTLISRDITSYLSSAIRYQLEEIRQYSASETKDDGRFRIGGITPSLALDLRDNKINTREGAFFSLSCEFANPSWYSQKNADLEINFFKLISRNKFYFSMGNWVWATSISTGYQKNLADQLKDDGSMLTKGYIPSIKVFRLDGPDVVRGFADGEINRVESGDDISELTITGRAYFVNVKIEPRYYLSDDMIFGLFVDAGRVYVDDFKPLDLRSSFGGSLKFLTPVGSLDFDYGIKFNREKLPDGQQEKFGRFHLSIGYF